MQLSQFNESLSNEQNFVKYSCIPFEQITFLFAEGRVGGGDKTKHVSLCGNAVVARMWLSHRSRPVAFAEERERE